MLNQNPKKKILITEGSEIGKGYGLCLIYDYSFLISTIKNQPWLENIENHTIMSIFLFVRYAYEKYGNLRDHNSLDLLLKNYISGGDIFDTAYLFHIMKEDNESDSKFKDKLYYKAIYDNDIIENYFLPKCLNFIGGKLKVNSRSVTYRLLCESDSIITKVRNTSYSFMITKRDYLASNLRKTMHNLFIEKDLFRGYNELELKFIILINYNFIWNDYEDLSNALGISLHKLNDFMYTLKSKKILEEVQNLANGKIKIILDKKVVY